MTALLFEWLGCLRLYLRLCLFMASPADLPARQTSLLLTLIAYVITGFVILGDQIAALTIIGHIAIELAVLSAFSYLVLRFQQRQERLLQTLSALIGSSLVISLISIPVMALLPNGGSVQDPAPLTLQVNLLLLFWSLAVISLIFRRAFEIPTLAAGFLAFNYFLLYELLIIGLLQ